MTVVVDAAHAGWRLDRFVAEAGGVSRAHARRLVEDGHVTMGGAVGRPRQPVPEGLEVTIEVPVVDTSLVPEPVEFGVVHEDDSVIVVDKPANLVVHPGAGHSTGTLLAGLVYRFPELAELGEERRYGLVHRLDRDTSGLLMVGRTASAFDELTAALAAREVTREYWGLVHGHLEAATATVDAPIARDPNRPTRMAVRAGGRPARTHFSRLAEWSEVSLISMRLETGRTHQIRVHSASIGHPIVGDGQYGGRLKSTIEIGRSFLHAIYLSFRHPVSGETVEFEAPLPGELVETLASLGPPQRGEVPGR
ncbi:MAG: RluA family pseudouridine synthase [Acidimicrobiia bacterium]|nr:RluA family pseudouridine synthase [Acidimicrobiia bacterium]